MDGTVVWANRDVYDLADFGLENPTNYLGRGALELFLQVDVDGVEERARDLLRSQTLNLRRDWSHLVPHLTESFKLKKKIQ